MISKYTTVIFPYTTIIPYHFLHGHRLFHLDNPDPFETETISNPIQTQKIPNIRLDWTPKSGFYRPLVARGIVAIHFIFVHHDSGIEQQLAIKATCHLQRFFSELFRKFGINSPTPAHYA